MIADAYVKCITIYNILNSIKSLVTVVFWGPLCKLTFMCSTSKISQELIHCERAFRNIIAVIRGINI